MQPARGEQGTRAQNNMVALRLAMAPEMGPFMECMRWPTSSNLWIDGCGGVDVECPCCQCVRFGTGMGDGL